MTKPWNNEYVCEVCGKAVINGLHNVGPWMHLDGSNDHGVIPVDRVKGKT